MAIEKNPELQYSAVTNVNWALVEPWLLEHFGEWNVEWYKVPADIAAVVVGFTETVYWFRTEEQATMFRLKFI